MTSETKTDLVQGPCELCWTVSWAPCPEGYKDGDAEAVSDGVGGWMVCSHCSLRENLRRSETQLAELKRKHEELMRSAEQAEGELGRIYAGIWEAPNAVESMLHWIRRIEGGLRQAIQLQKAG